MPIPTPAKRAAVVLAALLLGAPTAGAALKTTEGAPPRLSGGLLQIEYVIPPEPEVRPVYPVETFDQAPVNEYKRPPRAARWGYGFLDLEPVSMTAQAPGKYEDRDFEEPAAADFTAGGDFHSSFEPASGYLDD